MNYTHKVFGVFKLNNLSLVFKYNAILYFYHINSDYRDSSGFDINSIPSTKSHFSSKSENDIDDINIIYHEQIEEVESAYSTEISALCVYRILSTESMLDLLLSLVSLIDGQSSGCTFQNSMLPSQAVIIGMQIRPKTRNLSSHNVLRPHNILITNANANKIPGSSLAYDVELPMIPMLVPAFLPCIANL